MKKLIMIMIVLSVLTSCGFLGVEEVTSLPAAFPVLEGALYTESVVFTGNPIADFGAVTWPTNSVYNDGSQYRKLDGIFIAYNKISLYLAAETIAFSSAAQAMGRVIFMIDNGMSSVNNNGITNGGLDWGGFTADNKSYATDGTSANFGWDTLGKAVTNSSVRKISLYAQHWRPGGDDFAFFKTYRSPLMAAKESVSPRFPNSGTDASQVTEIAITWERIFGVSTTNDMPNSIWIKVATDSGISKVVTGAHVWPDSPFGNSDPEPSLYVDSSWFEIQLK